MVRARASPKNRENAPWGCYRARTTSTDERALIISKRSFSPASGEHVWLLAGICWEPAQPLNRNPGAAYTRTTERKEGLNTEKLTWDRTLTKSSATLGIFKLLLVSFSNNSLHFQTRRKTVGRNSFFLIILLRE